MQADPTDKAISDFIYAHPDVVARILRRHGYVLKTPLTLDVLTATAFRAADNKDHAFILDLAAAIENPKYKNIYTALIGAGISVVTSLMGANQAKKQREMMMRIELAKMSHAQMLEQEAIRTMAETERTKILLTTLQQYQSDLQAQSTQRLKDTGIYVVMIAAGIGIIYAAFVLLNPKIE